MGTPKIWPMIISLPFTMRDTRKTMDESAEEKHSECECLHQSNLCTINCFIHPFQPYSLVWWRSLWLHITHLDNSNRHYHWTLTGIKAFTYWEGESSLSCQLYRCVCSQDTLCLSNVSSLPFCHILYLHNCPDCLLISLSPTPYGNKTHP